MVCKRYWTVKDQSKLKISDQFLNHGPWFQRRSRPTAVIEKIDIGVDPQDMKHRVMYVGRSHGSFLRNFTQSVGGSHDSTTLHATSAHQAEHGISPVIPSRRSHTEWSTTVSTVVHSWSPAEFATEHHQHVIKHSALRQIFK